LMVRYDLLHCGRVESTLRAYTSLQDRVKYTQKMGR
jgi:hypothetical protein